MKRGLALGICGALLAMAGASSASAATPVGDYRFDNTLSSSLGVGPPLTQIGPGANAFASDSVAGPSQPVLTFPQNNGVRMSPAGLTGKPFSVVTTFRFASTSSYRRIIDWKNDTIDEGLYVRDGKLSMYYGSPTDSLNVLFTPGAWATVGFVSNTPDLGSHMYFNGARVGGSSVGPSIIGDTLRFFRDAPGGSPNEASAGAVACIRVFSGKLSDAEVAQIGFSPTCGGPPLPAAKKCKKAKKKKANKRSAAAAKKKHKKCKRKRKRKK